MSLKKDFFLFPKSKKVKTAFPSGQIAQNNRLKFVALLFKIFCFSLDEERIM